MRSSDARATAWLAATFLMVTGCEDPIDEPSDKAPFACELGVVDDEGAFTPLGDTAELVLGFQGFLMVPVALRAPDAPATTDARMQLDVEGGDTVGGEQPFVDFTDGVSAPILVFLTSDSVGEWEGRRATLTVRVEDATRYCITSAEVTLVDAVCDVDECP